MNLQQLSKVFPVVLIKPLHERVPSIYLRILSQTLISSAFDNNMLGRIDKIPLFTT